MKEYLRKTDLLRILFRRMNQPCSDTLIPTSLCYRQIIQIKIIHIPMHFHGKKRDNIVFIFRNAYPIFFIGKELVKIAGLIAFRIIRMIDRFQHFNE